MGEELISRKDAPSVSPRPDVPHSTRSTGSLRDHPALRMAPLAGLFFAQEVILKEFSAGAFGLAALSAGVAALVAPWASCSTPFCRGPSPLPELAP